MADPLNLIQFNHSNRILRFGRAGLELYTEIHHNTTNQIIHGLGMPFVGYAIFGIANFLFNSPLASLAIYLMYFGYYVTFDPIGAVFACIIFFPALRQSFSDWYTLCHYYVPEHNYPIFARERYKHYIFYLQVFCLSILVQEGIGHSFYEFITSDLYQLPNSITQAPLFGTRALMHNWLNYPLLP